MKGVSTAAKRSYQWVQKHIIGSYMIFTHYHKKNKRKKRQTINDNYPNSWALLMISKREFRSSYC